MRWFAAEFYAAPARYLFTLPDKDNRGDRDKAYQDALSAIEFVMLLQSGNPEYANIKSRLLINGCGQWDINERHLEWQQCQIKAMTAIRTSLDINSQSAYLWANLLLVKYNLRQFDAEFYEALEQCRTLGSHEFSVNRTVMFVGLREWQKWRPEHITLFLESLFAVQAVSPVKAKALADEAGQGSSYCLWTRADPKRHYSCKLKWKHKKP
jgi:hypothetical protein